VPAAVAHQYKSGETINLKIETYVYHPGNIVFLWTRDFEGKDMEPAWEIASMDTPIPQTNFLGSIETPCIKDMDSNCLRGRKGTTVLDVPVTLPDIEGEIILVVRQVMTDKLDLNDDGSVSLKRIYYHQATKINLVRS
jgi:hypothetical protein